MTEASKARNGRSDSGGAGDWRSAGSEPLSRQELRECVTVYKETGCTNARNRIVETHMRLVARAARQYAADSTAFDDLMIQGALALLRAADNFDPARGVSFTSYATTVVEHVVHAAAGAPSLVHVPSGQRRRVAARRRLEAAFFAAHGRKPNTSELVHFARARKTDLALSSEPVNTNPTVSLDEPLAFGTARINTIEDDHRSPADTVSARDEAQLVQNALQGFSADIAHIVCLRFGLQGQPQLSPAEIAARLGMEKREVDQILDHALSTIRASVGAAQP
jgi:RNA polymerase sigma factor (sigma-70 family)